MQYFLDDVSNCMMSFLLTTNFLFIRQRAGGAADGSDLKGGGKKSLPTFFALGGKKKAEPEPEPEPKKKNWWTLN